MRLSLDRPRGVNLITAYAPGELRVGGQVLTGSALVSAGQIIPGWGVASIRDLSVERLAPAFELEPEILVLGTGERLVFPERALHAALLGRGIGIEVMDTGAACRTYNILVADERRVVAALILEGRG